MTSRIIVDQIEGSAAGGNKITIPTGNQLNAPGHVIQVRSLKANYGWGTWGSQAEMNMTWMDITLTPRGTNSSFFIAAQFSVDDTNSGTFGVGLGSKWSTDSGSTWTWIRYPALHEIYDSGGTDKYNICYMNITTDALGVAANTPILFRCVARFNNSNAQHFGGNGGTYYAQLHTIMEIGS